MNTKKLKPRNRRARRNLARKLVLESRFLPELKKYFNKIVKEFVLLYSKTGQILPIDAFSPDTKQTLTKHYIRVSKVFKDEMRTQTNIKRIIDIKQNEQEEEKDIDSLIDEALVFFIAKESKNHSRLIDQTTRKNMTDSVNAAIEQLIKDDKDVNMESISKVAGNKLKLAFTGRLGGIALTETQFVAESTKTIEAAVIDTDGNINIRDVILGATLIVGSKLEKIWVSILDNKTRSAHARADGQRKKISEPFIVGGEMLLYPSDTSLGASVGNVANCRCDNQFS